jgi:hypothetical protein
VLERWQEERRLARKGCFEKKGEKDFGQNWPKLGLRRIIEFTHKMHILFSAKVNKKGGSLLHDFEQL